MESGSGMNILLGKIVLMLASILPQKAFMSGSFYQIVQSQAEIGSGINQINRKYPCLYLAAVIFKSDCIDQFLGEGFTWRLPFYCWHINVPCLFMQCDDGSHLLLYLLRQQF